jgi:tetratricopeptide (TPR) repeat protein
MNLKETSRSVVRIEGDDSFGTGFFFLKHYCLTCHHVVWPLSKIYVCQGKNEFRADWVEKFSSPTQDIAVLRVKKEFPLVELGSLTAGRRVNVWGFTRYTKDKLTSGFPLSGKLSEASTFYDAKSEESMGNQPWNTKPKVRVSVIGLSCNHVGIGLSGAPVWDSKESAVVGMLHSVQGSNLEIDMGTFGYVIPREVLPTERPQARSRQFDETGIKSLRAGALKTSLEYLEKSLEINPDNDQVLALKAIGLLRIGRMKQFQSCLDKVSEINPRNYHLPLLEGLRLLRQNKVIAASEYFRIAKVEAKNAGRHSMRLRDGHVKKLSCWTWDRSEKLQTPREKGTNWSFDQDVEHWNDFWNRVLWDDHATEHTVEFVMKRVVQQESEWWRSRLNSISVFYGMSPIEVAAIVRMTEYEVKMNEGQCKFDFKFKLTSPR